LRWKIEVSLKPDIPDAIGRGIAQDIEDIGIANAQPVVLRRRGEEAVQVHYAHIYWLDGEVKEEEIERICEDLLVDVVTQLYSYQKESDQDKATSPVLNESELAKVQETKSYEVVVSFKPGVTDTVGESVIKGIRDLGINNIPSARTGQKYVITGELEYNQVEDISRKLLANDVIQNFEVRET